MLGKKTLMCLSRPLRHGLTNELSYYRILENYAFHGGYIDAYFAAVLLFDAHASIEARILNGEFQVCYAIL